MAWEDVTFDCKNIVISADYIEPTTQETTTQNGEAVTKLPVPIDNSQIIDAIDTTLEQNDESNNSNKTIIIVAVSILIISLIMAVVILNKKMV